MWKTRTTIRLLLALLLTAPALGLAGCNTVEGLGKDISAVGRAMSGASSSDKSE